MFRALVILLLSAVASDGFHLPRRAARLTSTLRPRPPPPPPEPPSTELRASPYSTRNAIEGGGAPSNPGWKSGRLERLTSWADCKVANRPVICEYDPSGFWLWSKWSGTVLSMTWRSVLLVMVVGMAFDRFVRSVNATSWPLLAAPPSTDALIRSLRGLTKFWEYHLTLATFILTFFSTQAYSYWRTVYNTTRAIQGRINDFCMLLIMGAKRTTKFRSGALNGSVPADTYSDEGRTLVGTCTRLVRLSHTFFWAATPTASNGLSDCDDFLTDAANCPLPVDDAHIGPVLLSPFGLRALVRTGQLTDEEAEALMDTGLPPSQYAFVLLVWVGLHCMNGLRDGTLTGGNGFEENLLRQLTALRASMFDIDDFRAGRMSLAHVQLVQVLVDSLVMCSPFALYPELGSLSIPLVGLLALFFRGLLALSKSFLDPFGVESYITQNIRVDVLVSELNFGAAKRWIKAGQVLPVGRN